MKRDQLKELGLKEDQIDKIMALNGADIEKAKGTAAEANEQITALKNQLGERDKDLKKLKGQAKDSEELTNQIKGLQDKYNKDTEALKAQLQQGKLNFSVERSLNKAGVRNVKAIKGLLDMNTIKLDKDGQLSGLDEQVQSIKKSDPYLFNEGNKQNYKPSNGKPATQDPVQNMVDVFKRGEN